MKILHLQSAFSVLPMTWLGMSNSVWCFVQ